MGSSFATRQRLLNDASGIRRERDFYIPIQTENVAVKSHFDTNGLGKEILRLDNDAKGRADDIYWLQVKDGIAMCTLPLGPLFWMCDDNRNCCQVFPGGCEFCSDCCECFERYPTEIHSANSHRLTLYSNCMVFERDAHDRPIVTHWTTTDKYGNVTHHQGERMSVNIEILPMKNLPKPIYAGCMLQCWTPCCGEDVSKPKGSILAVRLSNGSKVLCCIDCGENSNALAFKKAFEDSRMNNVNVIPPQITQSFETSTSGPVMSHFQSNIGAPIMARGNMMQILQQQQMMNRNNMMMMSSTMNTTSVPTVTATAIPMNTTIPTVQATTVQVDANSVDPTAPPKEGMMMGSVSGGGGDITSQLAQLSQLHQSGALSDAEYQTAKMKVLGGA